MIAAVETARGRGTLRLPAGPTEPPSLQSPSPTRQQAAARPIARPAPAHPSSTAPGQHGPACLRGVGGAREPADNRGSRSTLSRALPANHVVAPPDTARDQSALPRPATTSSMCRTRRSRRPTTRGTTPASGPRGCSTSAPSRSTRNTPTRRPLGPLGRRAISIAAIGRSRRLSTVSALGPSRDYRMGRERHRADAVGYRLMAWGRSVSAPGEQDAKVAHGFADCVKPTISQAWWLTPWRRRWHGARPSSTRSVSAALRARST